MFDEAIAEALAEIDPEAASEAVTASTRGSVPSTVGGLTRREVEIIRRIAAGQNNGQLADELSISVRTVERHVANLYLKIDARNRADATAFAFRHGLLAAHGTRDADRLGSGHQDPTSPVVRLRNTPARH